MFHPKGLPDGVVNLKYLEELKFQPYVPGFSHSLEIPTPIFLDIKICKLKALKRLDLSDNYSTTHLPKCLGELPNLQEINVTNFHNLKEVPESIKKNF